MGYLSCKADSSISTVHSDHPSTPTPTPKKNKKECKPIRIEEFKYEDLESATDNFSDAKLLGRGSHGLVYKAVLRGGRLVAVKKPSQKPSENPNEFRNEIDLLSKLRSPEIVNLVGVTRSESRDRLLVVEFMSKGTLYDVLHSDSNPRPLTWGRRVKLSLQTARAVRTLHSATPPVVHRDIKSANVLIDRNSNARLGDFGLAVRIEDDSRFRSTPPAGTMGYLDPCYVTPDNLSTKTDVFSFGILLLEIISGRKALDMGNSPPSVVDWAIPLIRKGKVLAVFDPRVLPPKDPMVRKMLALVAAKCVRSCREKRPSMDEVVGCLAELSRMVPLHSWNGLPNPCLMVENVGRPVQSNVDDKNNVKSVGVLRNPGRVYSDLGFRRNLRELMSSPAHSEWGTCGEEDGGLGLKVESEKRVSSLRFEIGRSSGRRDDIRAFVLGDAKNRVSKSNKFSKVDVTITNGSSLAIAS